MFIASITGGVYAFSTYSGALKKQYGGFTQSELDTIGLSPYFIAWLSWSTGLFCDRAGPTASVAAGVAIQTVAVLVSYLVSAELMPHALVPSRSVAIAWLCVSGSAMFMGTSFETAAAFSTLVRRFPRQRGVVVGIAKGFVGLTGGVTTQLFAAFVMVPDDSAPTLRFILAGAIVSLVGGALAIALLVCDGERFRWSAPGVDATLGSSAAVRSAAVAALAEGAAVAPESGTTAVAADPQVISTAVPPSGGRFYFMYGVLAAMCVAVSAAALAGKSMGREPRAALGGVIAAIWLSPLALLLPPLWGPCERCELTARARRASDGEALKQPLLDLPRSNDECDGAALVAVEGGGGGGGGDSPRDRDREAEMEEEDLQKDLTLCSMLCTIECWLLFFSAGAIMGGGICITTNAAQMCEAKGFAGATPAVVTVFSVSQAAGRVLAGVLSEAAFVGVGRAWLPRPTFVLFSACIMGVAHALLLLPQLAALYLAMVVAGLAFGSIFPVLVVLVSELFGLRNHGSNYMFYDGTAAILGVFVLAKLLPQTVYTHAAHGAKTCIGLNCFFWTHAAIAIVEVFAALLALALLIRTRKQFAQRRRMRLDGGH